MAFTVGVGFTTILNVVELPAHVLDIGVTVMSATTGTAVALVAVNAGIFPVAVAASPIEVVLFVQLNVVPATAPVKFTAVIWVLLQTTWSVTPFTVGVGLTVTTSVNVAPVQPFVEVDTI